MSGSAIFYGVSALLGLYAAYVFTFNVYKADLDGNPERRIVFRNIVYLLVWLAAIIPFFNNVMCLCFAVIGLIAVSDEDVYIDSWFFRKPKDKKENNQ